MNKVLFFLALVFIACAVCATADSNLDNLKSKFQTIVESKSLDSIRAEVCGFEKYSFKKLKGKTYKGANAATPQYEFTLDFCASSTEPECKQDEGSICQYDTSRNNAFVGSLGSFTNAEVPPVYKYVVEDDPSAGVDVVFTNGAKCYSSGWVERRVTLRLTCGDAPETFSISEDPACTYFIDFPSKALCSGGGGSGGLSGGAIVLIVLLVVTVIYIITGCAICITKYGKPFGLQACPHRAFWFALPGLFIDGIKYTFGKIAGCCGSKTITTSSGEYEAA